MAKNIGEKQGITKYAISFFSTNYISYTVNNNRRQGKMSNWKYFAHNVYINNPYLT